MFRVPESEIMGSGRVFCLGAWRGATARNCLLLFPFLNRVLGMGQLFSIA